MIHMIDTICAFIWASPVEHMIATNIDLTVEGFIKLWLVEYVPV